MALDFIEYINQNTTMDIDEKLEMLDSFAKSCGWTEENSETKKEFSNTAIKEKIKEKIERTRESTALEAVTFDEFDIKEVI